MSGTSDDTSAPPAAAKSRPWLKGCCWGCGACVMAFLLLVVVLCVFLARVPKIYPVSARPVAPPEPTNHAAAALDGFESPYLGHTGSWDGKGGGMGGSSKSGDLDKEAAMGLRWTFMPVYWRALEPEGPVDLAKETPTAWQRLDAFVVEAHRRRLNILMQAPVMGGNAGGPPNWAGRREPGKSAPEQMDAAAAFAGKLASRYAPGGTLAVKQGWGLGYGVRAWELDNEPEGYLTHWKDQAGDYAEFATKTAARIKAVDPRAVIALPGCGGGHQSVNWIEGALDAPRLAGSPAYRKQAVGFSIGPVADVVSFHDYEGLDSGFAGGDRTLEPVLDDVRDVFERWETRQAGSARGRKLEFWHTEGNFDFLGLLSARRRAAWRMQMFTRAFAAGIAKVCVMDASKAEQVAVRAYVRALPWPFPMLPADAEARVVRGKARAFRHPEHAGPAAGQTWVLWARADSGAAQVEIPVTHDRVTIVGVDGLESVREVANHRLTLELEGDPKMAPPVLVLDRPLIPRNTPQ